MTGICGSGIIEMVAEMRMHGIVDAPGLIGTAEQTGSAAVFADGRTNSYLVYDGTADGGPKITVTNRDIREIQMAKAALYSGARLLMDKFGVDKVDRVVLAGAFGAHISTETCYGAGHDPRRAPRQGHLRGQCRRHRRAHRPAEPRGARPRSSRPCSRSTRSRPRSSRASRSIS